LLSSCPCVYKKASGIFRRKFFKERFSSCRDPLAVYIKRLFLNNYRNIKKITIEPSPEFNVLWGDNAQGKTNFLESIYLLGNLRSFRSSRNDELINHNSPGCHISGEVISQDVRRQLDLTIYGSGKTAKIDGKDIKNAACFMGFLRPILFSPEEVSLIKGNPAGRRALIDRAIFQSDPSFLAKAQLYERCLRQRNRLLKDAKKDLELTPWTEQLIAAGAQIRFERHRYLERLTPLLRETYSTIAGGREEADLQYTTAAGDMEHLQRSLRLDLARNRERELILGQTLAGPHRDDPLFLVDGRPLRMFGSQGQQRSFMLAFKTAQIMDLENNRGEAPVLLLDDMTGELDRQRQGFFFNFLLERRGQVFITTTDIQTLQQEGIKNAHFFHVSQGHIQN
jgi:DNA replication and repair protein RecF